MPWRIAAKNGWDGRLWEKAGGGEQGGSTVGGGEECSHLGELPRVSLMGRSSVVSWGRGGALWATYVESVPAHSCRRL